MNIVGTYSLVDLFFELKWEKDHVRHTDAHAVRQVNIWRDLLPAKVRSGLMGQTTGDRLELHCEPSELLTHSDAAPLKKLKPNQFDAGLIGRPGMHPRRGRFYPKGALKDLAGIFRENREPFRCVRAAEEELVVDLGHPLARQPLDLTVTVGAMGWNSQERGGAAQAWGEILTQGPGMQDRWGEEPTEFLADEPFGRKDGRPDAQFYLSPRLVHHLDSTALDIVEQLYGRFVEEGMQVLDLMASWHSHLPQAVTPGRLTGLGLNAQELEANRRLSDYRVHDLNADPLLPFPSATYDLAVCTVSVEYMTQPLAVFREVARMLKPGGRFVLTFSNRWFEPKVIRIWAELHEFERLGLVLEYFRAAEAFRDLHTYSLRGLERPVQDKYFGQLMFADPVYAVWGTRT